MKKKNFIDSSITLIISRKEIVFAVTWTASLASIIAGRGFPPVYLTLLAIFAVMMINLSVYIYNDVIDREMDAYSEQDKKRGRPLAHGEVSEKTALRFVGLTAIVGLAACYLLNLTTFSIGAAYFVILFLYSYPKIRFKTMYIVKNLITSLVMPAALLITVSAIEASISFSTLFIASSYFIMSFALLPAVADMLDYEEDLEFNVKTLGNTLSWKQNLLMFDAGVLVIIGSGIFSYIVLGMNILVPLAFSIIGIPLMLYSYMLRNESGLSASYKLRPLTYVLAMFAPLIFSIGAIL